MINENGMSNKYKIKHSIASLVGTDHPRYTMESEPSPMISSMTSLSKSSNKLGSISKTKPSDTILSLGLFSTFLEEQASDIWKSNIVFASDCESC